MTVLRFAVASCALLITACGQSPSTPSGHSAPPPGRASSADVTCRPPSHWADAYGGPIMRVSFKATNGISTVSCSFDNPEIYGGEPGSAATCATLASEEQTVPNFHSSSYAYGIDFDVRIPTDNFNGAGTYSLSQLSIDPMFFTDFTDQFGLVHYQTASGSTATVVINPDGSGSYTFAGFVPDDNTLPQQSGKPWPPVQGKVTWTCRDNPNTPTPGA